MAALLLLIQAVAGPPDDRPRRPVAATAAPCPPAGDDGEVVVCGRVGESPYRARALPERYVEPAVPMAQVKLKNGGTLTAHGEAGSVGNIPTNRAMVTLKLPF